MRCVYRSSFLAEFTSRFFGLTLQIQFTGPIYQSLYVSSLWTYELGLQSRLRVLIYRSNLIVEFTTQIYRTCFKMEVVVRD